MLHQSKSRYFFALLAIAIAAGVPSFGVFAGDGQLAQIMIETEGGGRQAVPFAVSVPTVIALPVIPGTGYAWDPQKPLPAGIALTGSKTVSDEPGLPGGRAHQFMTFVSATPGTAEVVLVLRQSWMPPDPNDKTVSLRFETK